MVEEEEVVVGVPTTTEVYRLLEGATITTAERGPGMTIMTPGQLSTQEVATMTIHRHRDMDHVSLLFDCGFNLDFFYQSENICTGAPPLNFEFEKRVGF